MGWIIFFISSIVIFIITKPFKNWGNLWYAGIISLPVLYIIDSVLISLGAFSFQYPNPVIGELPTLYWLSSFFGGIILVKYFPKKNVWRFPYITFSAFLFLILELVMCFLGYFNYHNWKPINSFFLNISGFIIVIWIWNWINEFKFQ